MSKNLNYHVVDSVPNTKDLALHIYTNLRCGKAVIVADNPKALLPALRKQWLKIIRRMQVQRASTLNSARISELTSLITRMQTLTFSAKYLADQYPTPDVSIATTDQLLDWAPECQTLYVACDIRPVNLHIITSMMPKGGLVIAAKQNPQ